MRFELPAFDDGINRCGACAECCVALPIAWENGDVKPAHVPCRHLEVTLCGIQETKPKLCKDFLCSWRVIADMAEAGLAEVEDKVDFAQFRPDRCGAIIVTSNELLGDLDAYLVTETVSGALDRRPKVLAFAAHLATQGGVPIAITFFDGTRKLVVPEMPSAPGVVAKIAERLKNLLPGQADKIGAVLDQAAASTENSNSQSPEPESRQPMTPPQLPDFKQKVDRQYFLDLAEIFLQDLDEPNAAGLPVVTYHDRETFKARIADELEAIIVASMQTAGSMIRKKLEIAAAPTTTETKQ